MAKALTVQGLATWSSFLILAVYDTRWIFWDTIRGYYSLRVHVPKYSIYFVPQVPIWDYFKDLRITQFMKSPSAEAGKAESVAKDPEH